MSQGRCVAGSTPIGGSTMMGFRDVRCVRGGCARRHVVVRKGFAGAAVLCAAVLAAGPTRAADPPAGPPAASGPAAAAAARTFNEGQKVEVREGDTWSA